MDPATTQAVAKAAEESAKTAGQALEIVHDTGGYLRQMIDEVPTDLVGVLGGAWLHERHIRIRDALRCRTEQLIRERNVEEIIELSPNQATELLTAAQDESREELAELWARLLANAMDSNMNTVRHSFIEAVKKMDSMDAIVLQYIFEEKMTVVRRGRAPEPIENQTTGIENISRAIDRGSDEVEVSLRHLKDLSFFDEIQGNNAWYVNATSREFMRACYPELAAVGT
jgi:hypothetical protein